jgi:hypothetical protein
MNGDNGKLLKTQSLKSERCENMHAQAFFQKKINSGLVRLLKYNLIFIKKELTPKSMGCEIIWSYFVLCRFSAPLTSIVDLPQT